MADIFCYNEIMNLAKFAVRPSKHGKGVFVLDPVNQGDVFMHIAGKIFPAHEIDSMEEGSFVDNTIRFSKDTYLSPWEEPYNFLNHSCDPNCGVRKIDEKLFLVAIKDLEPEDELMFDYSTVIADDDFWIMKPLCNCGTIDCRGTIGQFHKIPQVLQEKYLGLDVVPEYIYS